MAAPAQRPGPGFVTAADAATFDLGTDVELEWVVAEPRPALWV